VSAGEFQGQDAMRLRPIKVLGRVDARPQRAVDIGVGDFARLTGYNVDLPEGGVSPGDAFTATLFFRADGPAALPYTRFLHFWSPELGMAAQADSEPAGGRNPTWAWTRGETVVDVVRLTVAADAQPGAYQLRAGLYDPASGARVPLRTREGEPLPDDIATLGTIEVLPGR
nr:hypothetical protein [Anaerolineae bacterium]